jgi:trans-L-3-hydroxyproline dehydratase
MHGSNHGKQAPHEAVSSTQFKAWPETMTQTQPNARDGVLRIRTVDAHAAGEPLRVIVDGFPQPPGVSVLERRRWARENADALRTALMWEPRGHADMYGCLLMPPVHADSDLAVLFLHNEGFSTMCGHGIIAVTTVLLETGLVQPTAPQTELRIDTPAGLVVARGEVRLEAGARVDRVAFINVPSWVAELDATIDVPGMGRVRYDLAFGGAFYAYVDAASVGLTCTPDRFRDLIDAGVRIKRAIMAQRPIEHPFEPDLGFLYGTIFVGPPESEDAHSRNVCVFADGEVDRSPTGTGVSGRVAIHHARGDLKQGETIEIESIIGTTFRGRVLEETTFGPHAAIVPEVSGSAWVTGRNEILIDPSDPLRDGFLLR